MITSSYILVVANGTIPFFFMAEAYSQEAQGKSICLPMRETQARSLGWEDPLETGMATHSSILAWRIPWTEEPGGLPSTGLQSWTRPSY